MSPGSLVVTPLHQADGLRKNRPALLLLRLPPFGDVLVCGVSSPS
jgi:mRNA interferase MazF